MAVFEHDFEIGLRDVEHFNMLGNKAILALLENIGALHSDSIHFGLNEIPETKASWVLLGWKVQILKRPMYGDKLHIKTWVRNCDKISTYRDFEIYNQNDELMIFATSKWILVSTETWKLIKIPNDVIEKYSPINRSIFPEGENTISKATDSEEYQSSTIYTIHRSQIDMNNHLHNIYYMDLAYEVLPKEVWENLDFTKFEIIYKHQIKLHDVVKIYYTFEENTHKIIIKDLTNKILHAVIKFQ